MFVLVGLVSRKIPKVMSAERRKRIKDFELSDTCEMKRRNGAAAGNNGMIFLI